MMPPYLFALDSLDWPGYGFGNLRSKLPEMKFADGVDPYVLDGRLTDNQDLYLLDSY